ncbi:hypothetical protein D3C84_969320 [compost metagenome]
MNKDAFDFWNSWQNEIVNSRNPIYPSNTSLKSNIKGGIGIWAGYGQSTILVRTPPKNKANLSDFQIGLKLEFKN